MGETITLDVLDRPRGGRGRLKRLPRAPGVKHRILVLTGRFVDRPRPYLTPRRHGLLTVWEDGADPALQALPAAREHWHVHGEVARASFDSPWQGWMPDTTEIDPMRDDEPALILISGNLRAGAMVSFVRDSFGAVGHAFRHPGYLGGLGIASSPLNTTSCSAWRTYADARDYAYSRGDHATAMRRDRQLERHRTNWFLRVRPLAVRGTLDGRPVLNVESPALVAPGSG